MKKYLLIGFALYSILFFSSWSTSKVFAITPAPTPTPTPTLKPTPTPIPKPTPTPTLKPTPTKAPAPTTQPTKAPQPTIPAVINPLITPAPQPSIVVRVVTVFKQTVQKIGTNISRVFYRFRPVKKKPIKKVIKPVTKNSRAFFPTPKVIKKPTILNQ